MGCEGGIRLTLPVDSDSDLERFIHHLQTLWQLRDWQIDLRRVPEADIPSCHPNASGQAACAMEFYGKLATVFLADDWRVGQCEPYYSDRFAVAHELAHILVRKVMDATEGPLGWMPLAARQGVEHELREREERLCNVLAASVTGERGEIWWENGKAESEEEG